MEDKITYYNCHTHRKPQSEKEVCIRNAFLHEPPLSGNNYYFSSGLHPWLVENYTTNTLENLLNKLAQHPKNKAIGEIGLDKRKPHFEKQMTVFLQQLALAEKHHKPLIIHAVKALDEIIAPLRSFKGRIVMHSFQGNIQQWEQLNKNNNVFVSFGSKSLLNNEKLNKTIQAIPLPFLLTETDNAPVSIQKIYAHIAQLKNLSKEAFAHSIESNFQNIFGSNQA